MSRHPYQTLIRPLLTEKATDRQHMRCPQYTFLVASHSNKVEIRKAVERAFDVKVRSVNILVNKGKRKRLRFAKLGRRASWKKAMVTLAEDQAINLI